GCNIDHHRPRRGPYARPDLECEYSNLYWACSECNENKSDTWPDTEDYERGLRFIDPCTPEGDHDLHWRVLPDGSLGILTLTGAYTAENWLLWREQLQYHRAQVYQWQEELNNIIEILSRKEGIPEQRSSLEARMRELNDWLEPPVFDRSRRSNS